VARYLCVFDVARPLRVVWEFIETPENAPRYVEGCISCTQISGVRKGVGTRVLRMVSAGGAGPTDATEDVLEYVDGSHMRRTGRVSWFCTYDATSRVEAHGSGTRVTLDYTYRPTLGAILTLVFWPLFLLSMRGRIDRMAAAAKRVLESEDAGAYRAAG
jgi:carbon monoxide dehydrogenase subunit G